MAYSWVGWFLHTLPWLSTSPRRTSRENRIVSTSHKIWGEEGKGRGRGRGREGEIEWEWEGDGGEGEGGEGKGEGGGGYTLLHSQSTYHPPVTISIKLCVTCTHACKDMHDIQLSHTHTGGNVKVEDGGMNLLHVVLEQIHHCIHGNHRAMDGNSHMHSASGLIHSQSISHFCNVEGLPHPRPGGSHHSDTGTVYMCTCMERSLIPNITNQHIHFLPGGQM